MINFKPFLSKNWYWIAAGIVLVFAVKCCANRSIWDETSILQGQLTQAKVGMHVAKEKAEAREKSLLDYISMAKGKIATLSDDYARQSMVLASLRGSLSVLEGSYAALTECPDKLVNMTFQRDNWKAQFTVAEGQIANKDSQIFLVSGQYKAAAEGWAIEKDLRVQAEANLALATGVNDGLVKQIKSFRLWSKVKTYVLIGAVSYTVYTMLKKAP